jgi:hypothetical protein
MEYGVCMAQDNSPRSLTLEYAEITAVLMIDVEVWGGLNVYVDERGRPEEKP